MKKTILLIPLILIILTTFAHSEDFKGFKYPNEKFTLNQDNFTILLDLSWKTAIFKINSEPTQINKGSCKQTNFYNICYKEPVFNTSRDLGKLDDRTGASIPALNISITYFNPKLKITKKFSNPTPLVGEEITVTINLSNEGNKKTQIELIDPLPENITVIEKNFGAINEKNQLIYTSTIHPGSSNMIRYKFKTNSETSNLIKTQLNYSYEDIAGAMYGTQMNFSTKKTIATTNPDKLDLPIGSNNEINIELYNQQEIAKEAEFSITFPKNIVLVQSTPQLTLTGQKYELSELIKPKEKIEIQLQILGTQIGDYTINLTTKSNILSKDQIENKQIQIKISKQQIIPIIEITEKTFSSDQTIKITAKINNSDEKNDFYNIKTKFASKDLTKTADLSQIVKNQDITIFIENLTLPYVEKSETYQINFTGTYNALTGEQFNFSTNKIIFIQPIKELLIIHHEFDKWENTSNIIKLNVYLENKKDQKTNLIKAYDQIPSELSLVEGMMSTSTFIQPKSKTKVYSYILKIPDESQKDSYEIITNIEYNETKQTFLLQKISTINSLKKSVKTEEIITQIISENTTQTNIPETEKNIEITIPPIAINENKSLWTKIKDFFSGIFK